MGIIYEIKSSQMEMNGGSIKQVWGNFGANKRIKK
jgi:hypothetical protein